MKIGILGGTFDPPHIGHLVIAEQAYAQLGLDKVWFTPVGTPPHKDTTRVSPVQHRIEMTRLAKQDKQSFELCLTDASRPTPHYIVTLFELLSRQFPTCEWYLIIGADSLVELPRWYEPARLLQLTRLAVAHRPGFQPDFDHLEKYFPGLQTQISWVDSPMIDIASRDLQRRAREGLPLRYVLTQEVARYINDQHLYTGADTNGPSGITRSIT